MPNKLVFFGIILLGLTSVVSSQNPLRLVLTSETESIHSGSVMRLVASMHNDSDQVHYVTNLNPGPATGVLMRGQPDDDAIGVDWPITEDYPFLPTMGRWCIDPETDVVEVPPGESRVIQEISIEYLEDGVRWRGADFSGRFFMIRTTTITDGVAVRLGANTVLTVYYTYAVTANHTCGGGVLPIDGELYTSPLLSNGVELRTE